MDVIGLVLEDIWFYALWLFVFSVTVGLIFTVAKDANHKKGYDKGYKDGYKDGINRQTNCMVRHMHDAVDKYIDNIE